MSIRNDLISAIRRTVGTAFSPPPPPSGNSPQAGRVLRNQDAHLYEQYLWTLTLEAAQRENASIDFWDVFGNRITSTPSLVFRAGPGMIYSTKRPYTHARILFSNVPPLEAHVNIRVAGSSDVVHECDVLVLSQVEAETCRRQRVLPRASKAHLGIECKLHGSEIPSFTIDEERLINAFQKTFVNVSVKTE